MPIISISVFGPNFTPDMVQPPVYIRQYRRIVRYGGMSRGHELLAVTGNFLVVSSPCDWRACCLRFVPESLIWSGYAQPKAVNSGNRQTGGTDGVARPRIVMTGPRTSHPKLPSLTEQCSDDAPTADRDASKSIYQTDKTERVSPRHSTRV